MKKIVKLIAKYRKQVLCILAGFILFAALKAFLPSGEGGDASYLVREGYGDNESMNKVYVSGLLDDEVELDIPVKGRSYTDEEIEDAFDKCMDEVLEILPAGNVSLQEVRSDLDMVTDMDAYGFVISWESSDSAVLNRRGKVSNEKLKEAADVNLTATLTDTVNPDRSATYVIPVKVLPPFLTEDETKVKGYMEDVNAADEAARNEEGMWLPEAFDGSRLSYRKGEKVNLNLIWILGIVAAVLLYIKDRNDEKEKKEKRLKQMLMDYPEIVSKLMVFIGAGMSIRQTWNRICEDYAASGRRRHAYDEMCKADNKLKNGMQEGRVYREFGRDCAGKQYMKLASLLEQNRRSGIAGLKSILSLEMVEAWEERKNEAKRSGEEASTKLLAPLVMMLGVVLVIVMAPAMMKM